ncbi:MAG TPA: tetratricopeptide repeat protein [Paludibacter sp.]|nr:tetratricopeptide repeat protein [Paludibacter sp.]
MKQLLIILTLILTANVCSQTLEERAAIRACDCVQKTKTLNDENYRKCLATSLANVIAYDKNPNDMELIGTVSGIQGVFKKIDSIVSTTCVVYSKEKLDKLRKKFYSDSKKSIVNNSYIIGNDFTEEKKYDIAIESYEIALKYDSLFVPAIDNLAVCYRKKGDLDSAIKYYKKSLSIYPEGDYALMNIGVIYTEKSEYKTSNEYYRRLVRLYPDNAEGYFGLGKNLVLLNEYESALENIFTAHKIYQQEKSEYVNDTQKIIEMIYQEMKKINKEEDFNKIARKMGIEII